MLVLGAALAIYALVAWMISAEPGASNEELERRVAALEEQRSSAPSPSDLRHAPARHGELYATLQANPVAARRLLAGWTQDSLVTYLGWPERLGTEVWGYEPRVPGAQFLQVLWGDDGRVSGIRWSPLAPSKE